MRDTPNSSWAKLLALYFGISFAMHIAWETAQMPLFVSPNKSFMADLTMCLFATATGDMLFMLFLYLMVAVVHVDLRWLNDKSAYRHPATWVIPAVVGSLLAISFELWAIHAVKRWQYDTMPIVPVLQVGVSPLLQMILIPLATIGICACRSDGLSTPSS